MSVIPLKRCDWCGEAAHVVPLACPRIVHIRYEGDSLCVYFERTPVIIAFKDLPTLRECVSVEQE